MKDKNIPVTYVLYPDEGHGFHRPENNKSFNAVTEAFLAKQLGGRFEPVGDDFKGATITVPVGRTTCPACRGTRHDSEAKPVGLEVRQRRGSAVQSPRTPEAKSASKVKRRKNSVRNPLASAHPAHNAVMSRTYFYYFWFTFTRLGSGTGSSA